MKQYECNECPTRNCWMGNTHGEQPNRCLFGRRKANWQAVDHAGKLPGWCKVGMRFEDSDGNLGVIEKINKDRIFVTFEDGNTAIRDFEFAWEEMEPRPQLPLPEWCKVGAWVWYGDFGFGKVVIPADKVGVCVVDWNSGNRGGALPEQLKPARLLPWTHKTIPPLPFAVRLKYSDYFADTITTCSVAGVWFARHTQEMIRFDELLDIAVMPDGSPCGTPQVIETQH